MNTIILYGIIFLVLLAVLLAAGISFVDDIRSLPDSGTFGCVVPVGDWNLSI